MEELMSEKREFCHPVTVTPELVSCHYFNNN